MNESMYNEENELIQSGQLQIIHADSTANIIEIKTFEAAMFYSSLFNVSYWDFLRSEDHFNRLLKRGPIYIIDVKNSPELNRSYAIYDCTIVNYTIRDSRDDTASFFVREFLFANVFPESFQNKLLSLEGTWIEYVSNPTVKQQMIAVENNFRSIASIKNPSPLIQFAAARKIVNHHKQAGHSLDPYHPDVNVFSKIDHMDESVQLFLIQNDFRYFNSINNPTEKAKELYNKLKAETLTESVVYGDPPDSDPDAWSEEQQLAYVKEEAWHLLNIDHPTVRVQIAAIHENPNIIRDIKNAPAMLQWLAIKMVLTNAKGDKGVWQKCNVLLDVTDNSNLDPSIAAWILKNHQDIMIDKDGEFLSETTKLLYNKLVEITTNQLTESTNSYVADDPNTWTEEQQIAYVKRDGYTIDDITNPSIRVQIAAVEEVPGAIIRIKRPPALVQYLAFKLMFGRNPRGSGYIITVIEYLEDKIETGLDESVQLYIVKERPEFFKNIKKPTDKVKKLYQSYLDELEQNRISYLEKTRQPDQPQLDNSNDK